MTDNQIIKALECCSGGGSCKECPYDSTGCDFEKDVLDLINRQKVEIATLKDLINGEWVDCDKVQEALSIDFSTGLKMFDFSRTAEWNPPPLNGQKITIKFRLKGFREGRWKGAGLGDYYCSLCCTTYSGGDEFDYCPHCSAYMK